MVGGVARTAHEHGGGAEVATVAWLGDGEAKSERGRAREWKWERASAGPPFTPSALARLARPTPVSCHHMARAPWQRSATKRSASQLKSAVRPTDKPFSYHYYS